ncbi:FxsC protein [Streptomyces sp. NPDC059605]|uniref:FxsC protein n=1 Tax=unclassified Streptomyces TaxID=2593676 RepID=UPI003678B322
MPDRTDGLGPVVDSLLGLGRDLDAVSIAELLWLAARDDSPSPGDGPGTRDAGSREEPDARVADAGQPAETNGATRRSPLHTPWKDGAPSPGAAEVSLPRDSALPRGRELARALKPLKRPWPRGRRQRLDVPATVADYARVGELAPVFSGEPERWFDATVVIDRSPTMAVWAGTADELVRLLARSGVFRTLRVRELYTDGAPGNAPALHGPLGQRVVEGGGRSVASRRLMLVLSDWASAAWRDGSQWNQLRTWAVSMPTVLLNPLPSKIWRQTGMSLPAVRVVPPGTPGAHNARLRFVTTLLMNQAFPGTTDRDWLPVPVSSLSPHAIGGWARALMLPDPTGCEALLLPAPGLVDQLVEQDEEGPRSGRSLTDAYLHRASPAAVRLAVLCSLYPQVSVDVLRVVQQSLVPEATPSDLAEFVVGGLVTVTEAARAGGHPVLRFRDGTREQLMSGLGARDARLLHNAVDRFVKSNSASSTRFPAAVPGAGAAGVPVDPEPFGEVSTGVLLALGIPVETPTPADLTVAASAEHPPAEPPSEPVVPRTQTAVAGESGRVVSRTPLMLEGRTDRATDPYFFLSYAHTPGHGGEADPDKWVAWLFQDLCDHVAAMTDLSPGTPSGFIDRQVSHSDENRAERIGEALATCRVFVPLFSPSYFADETCAEEWNAFTQRPLSHPEQASRTAKAIVPAFWMPVPSDQLPEETRQFLPDHQVFGDRYVSDGLYGLIKLRLFAEEYERAVYELAKRIVSVADATRIHTEHPVDHRIAPSVFGPSDNVANGPRPMHVTVVAPTLRNLPKGRAPEYYGGSAQDWNPYHPATARPLAYATADLVRSLNYQVTVSSFDDEVERGNSKQPPSKPEILLIDRWALQDENRRRRLAALDTGGRPWATIVVPWNRQDRQSMAVEAELTELLEQTMPTLLRQGRRQVRAAARGVLSMESFGRVLPHVVGTATQQYLRHAVVYPPVTDGHGEWPRP